MKINRILIPLLIMTLLVSGIEIIKALDVEPIDYRVEDLRAYLVGGYEYDEELDYNQDGRIDIMDLMETKDLSDVYLPEDKNTGLGFGKITAESKNEMGRVTTKPITTRKITTVKTVARTTRKAGVTTTKGSTKIRTTTTRKSTSTTSRTTTTRTTTTTAPKKEYTISVKSVNGSVDEASKTVVERGKIQFKVTPKDNYVFKEAKCSGGSAVTYSTSTKTLSVSSVTKNDTCTVEFDVANIYVNVVASYGVAGTNRVSGSYGDTKTATVTPKKGYTFNKLTCDTGVEGSYDESKNLLTVKLVKTGKCTVYFKVQQFNMKIKDGVSGEYGMDKAFTYKDSEYSFTYKTERVFKSLNCNGKSVSFTKSGTTTYTYKFKYLLTENTICTFNV